MDKKRAAIENMKRLIKARRAEIDPKILDMARRAAEESQGLRPKGQMVPYDRAAPSAPDVISPAERASAAKAVELFLSRHPEQKKFRAKLLAFLTKSSH